MLKKLSVLLFFLMPLSAYAGLQNGVSCTIPPMPGACASYPGMSIGGTATSGGSCAYSCTDGISLYGLAGTWTPVCQGGSVVSGSGCACPAGTTISADGNSCVTNTPPPAPSCGTGQYLDPSSGTCQNQTPLDCGALAAQQASAEAAAGMSLPATSASVSTTCSGGPSYSNGCSFSNYYDGSGKLLYNVWDGGSSCTYGAAAAVTCSASTGQACTAAGNLFNTGSNSTSGTTSGAGTTGGTTGGTGSTGGAITPGTPLVSPQTAPGAVNSTDGTTVTVSGPGIATTTTTTTVTENCNGAMCTTTAISPTGAKTVTTQTQAAFCEQNPNDPACKAPVCDILNHPDQCLGTPASAVVPTRDASIYDPTANTVAFTSNATCPAPVDLNFTLRGTAYHYSISYQPMCDLMAWLRPLILTLAALSAGIIFAAGLSI